MGKRERVEFILEQMRLCLAKKDTVRTQIISKKISTRFFSEEDTHDLKLKYYDLMLQLAQHDAKLGSRGRRGWRGICFLRFSFPLPQDTST